jgi:hypothetical protein
MAPGGGVYMQQTTAADVRGAEGPAASSTMHHHQQQTAEGPGSMCTFVKSIMPALTVEWGGGGSCAIGYCTITKLQPREQTLHLC